MDPVSHAPPPLPPPFPPQVLPYSTPGAVGTVYAGFGQRLLAWLVDWAVLAVIRFVLIILFGSVGALIDAAGGNTDDYAAALGFTVIATLYLCAWPYYALLEASGMQSTLGKQLVGIQVEDIEGGRATRVQTSVRFFLRLVSALIFGFGFLAALMTSRRQT